MALGRQSSAIRSVYLIPLKGNEPREGVFDFCCETPVTVFGQLRVSLLVDGFVDGPHERGHGAGSFGLRCLFESNHSGGGRRHLAEMTRGNAVISRDARSLATG